MGNASVATPVPCGNPFLALLHLCALAFRFGVGGDSILLLCWPRRTWNGSQFRRRLFYLTQVDQSSLRREPCPLNPRLVSVTDLSLIGTTLIPFS